MDPDRTVRVGDLVTLSEIASLASVRASAVSNWVRRHEDFPSPVLDKFRAQLWDWSEVRSWLRATNRLDEPEYTQAGTQPGRTHSRGEDPTQQTIPHTLFELFSTPDNKEN